MCIDAFVTICSYHVMSWACQLNNYTLATEENVRNVQSAHVAITFQLLKMSSITTANQTISNICTRYFFQRCFRENIRNLNDLYTEKKNNLEVSCKGNRFGYSNSCKRLPNFVNVATLPRCGISSGSAVVAMIKSILLESWTYILFENYNQ